MSEQSAKGSRGRLWRALALVAGVGLLGTLIYTAGAGRVLEVIAQAGPWVPLIVVLDVGWYGSEVLAHRLILQDGGKRVPTAPLLRTALTSYAFLVLVPLGRGGAEVARAAELRRYVGGPRAAAAGIVVQSTSLLANATVSVPCAVAAAMLTGSDSMLTLAICLNAAITAIGGSALLLVIRRGRVGMRLAQRLRVFVGTGPAFDEAARTSRVALLRATGLALLGRFSQTFQYGVTLLAVGGLLTPVTALTSQGIHLVGAAIGDFIPGGMGAIEGAYAYFAPALGFADQLDRAISIALLARVSQIILATTTLVGLALWRRPPVPVEED